MDSLNNEEENHENNYNINNNQCIISESDLFDVYENQYNFLFPKILKISEENFFALLQEQVLLNLRIINKLSDLTLMSFFQKLFFERYKTDKEKSLDYIEKINKLKEEEKIYLNYNNCYIHCKNNLNIEHKCGNKLIIYNEFIFCLNCKKVFNENIIKLYCKSCDKIFFSKLRKNNDIIINNNNDDEYEEEILYPVAFGENHGCKDNEEKNNELNEDEKIICLKCGSGLYLNLLEKDDNFLICEKCKLIFDIRNTKFKCPFCEDFFFTNKIKLYNDFSNEKIKMIFLIHTLMKEKKAFPVNLKNKKCKCDIKEIKEFKHLDDNGYLLQGNFFGNKKIVCDQCFQIWDIKNFNWKCPICKEEFIEEIENEQNENNIIELEKEIKNEEKEEKNNVKEEKESEYNNLDIYDENFEDYEEYKEDSKIKNEIAKEFQEDKKEKKDEIKIYEYKKEKDIKEFPNINNDKNNLKKEEIKSNQATINNKIYNVIENNKTIKIDLSLQPNIKTDKKNKITKDNKIKNKKFYINNYNQSYNSNLITSKKNEKNNNIPTNIIINNRKNHNIIESKYSSNSSNKKDNFYNKIQNNIGYMNAGENNKNKNKRRSNHQIVQIKEINKTNIKINHTMIENKQLKEENKKTNKNNQEFKNIQKYFDDFTEEYAKQIENEEKKKKKILKNNNNNNPKTQLNEKQIKNANNILYNIKYENKNSNLNNNNYNNKITSQNKLNKNSSSNKLKINPKLNSQYKSITSLNIDNYRNIKVLGRGSYGKIYLVEDITTKEQYAMKKLILDDEFELKDNQDEFNMIMQISSSYPEINIIHVYATETKPFDEYNFVFYVLMEVANCDWEKELQNRSKHKAYYSENELLYIMQSLVDTFAYLQQIGICHRDIKPQNILCFGEKGYKISDFGEAKFRKKWRYEQNTEGYTSMQTVRGTELYMSPILYNALKSEPGKGVNHNVFKSDVFSLGMCFLFASCLDYKCLYDMRKVKNMNDVKNVVDKFLGNKYSNNIRDILYIMLNLNEKERPDFIELCNMI